MNKAKPPKDKFGRHAGRWWKKARDMWTDAAAGNYKPEKMAADLATLAVEGVRTLRSLAGSDDDALPIAYKELARADLKLPQALTIAVDEGEVPNDVELMADALVLVSEFQTGGNPKVRSLPFEVARETDDSIKVTIKAQTPADVVPGIYEGFVRGAVQGKPNGMLFAIIKLRVEAEPSVAQANRPRRRRGKASRRAAAR